MTTMPEPKGTILVPVSRDRDPAIALRVATALARASGDRIELAAVERAGRGPVEIAEFLRSCLGRIPDDVDARAQDLGPGEPAQVLVEHLDGCQAGMMVMATRGLRPVGEWILGSVATEVLRASPIPVVLVGPVVEEVPERYERIVAAVDGSELSESAAAVACALARRTDAQLGLVEVLEPDVRPKDVLESAYLGRVAEQLQPRPRWWDVLHGDDPADAILDAFDDAEVILATGTHGRTGLRQVVLGSVALSLVRHAPGPVLVVPHSAMATGRHEDRHRDLARG